MSHCVVTVGEETQEPHRLYKARVDAGLSQAEAAGRIGKTGPWLNAREHFREAFTTDEIRKLEAIYAAPYSLFCHFPEKCSTAHRCLADPNCCD